MSGIHVNVVTPFGPITEADTDAVIAPGALGEFEVLEGHVPFLSELHPGVLTIGEKSERSIYAIGKGFLEVEPTGNVQVLVDRAVEQSAIDLDAAKAELAEVEPEIKAWKGELDGEYQNLVVRRDWADAQIRASRG